MTPDGKRAVSASDDKTLKVWDLESGCPLRILEGHADWVWGVAVTPDGKRAVSASDDKTLKMWDLESGVQVASFYCDGNVFCCALAGKDLIVAGDSVGRMYCVRLVERR